MKKIILLLLLTFVGTSFCMQLEESSLDNFPVYPVEVFESRFYSKESALGGIPFPKHKPNLYESANNLVEKGFWFKGIKVQGFKKIYSIPGFIYQIPAKSDKYARKILIPFIVTHPFLFSDEEKNLYATSVAKTAENETSITRDFWLYKVTELHLLVKKTQKKKSKD